VNASNEIIGRSFKKEYSQSRLASKNGDDRLEDRQDANGQVSVTSKDDHDS